MRSNFFKTFALLLSLSLFFVCCAPQVAWFNVDVQDTNTKDIDISNKQVAVFAVCPQNPTDSLRVISTSLGTVEKLEQDRQLDSGKICVFSLPEKEFAGFSANKGSDNEYFNSLMLNSGADLQIFIHSLNFKNYTVSSYIDSDTYQQQNVVVLPFTVGLSVLDALKDSLVLNKVVVDTVYLSVQAENVSVEDLNLAVNKSLPQISKKIGENLSGFLSKQWITKARKLYLYPDNQEWEDAYAKAVEFKFDQAIAIWSKYTSSKQATKAAVAAYNIAVACELSGLNNLALEWINFSLSKQVLDNSKRLKEHLMKR